MPDQEYIITPAAGLNAEKKGKFASDYVMPETSLIFCVWAPPYLEWSGGSMALHRLVHMLTAYKQEAYTVCTYRNQSWLGKNIEEKDIKTFVADNIDRVVMIYPEVVEGNPYGAKNVVRWLLNDPAITIGRSPSFEESRLIFSFCDNFHGIYSDRIAGYLNAFDMRLDSYVDKKQHIPGKVCYTIRKGYNQPHDQHPADAIQIRDYSLQQTGEELIRIFDQCETFISYDAFTFLSVHAALRGCDSVVIPVPGLSKEDWRKKSVTVDYGVAYGWDDLQRARETRPLMLDGLRDFEFKSWNRVLNFIHRCIKEFE